MDDVRVGRILRALRRRRGWTQRHLGDRLGLSQQAVSLIERGHGSRLAGSTMRRAFGALDARWEPIVSWRGGHLDRLLDEDHAALVGQTVRLLASHGWRAQVEATYSVFGERGSIDVLGADRDSTAIVVVEVKSELAALDATIRKLDEKERIVRRSLGRERFGFSARRVGRLLILPSTETSRRRVRTSSAILAVALPARGADVRRWLRQPSSDLSGILFLSSTNPSGGTRVGDGSHRVRGRGMDQG